MAFSNKNICKNHNLTLGAGYAALADVECSEIVVLPSAATTFSDDNSNLSSTEFVIAANTEFTFRGITNSNQISAKGTGTLYYRTQYYGSITPVAS